MHKIPEQGQLVKVRNRFFLVQDISEHQADDTSPAIHKVSLECLDDDKFGENIELLWEREPESHIDIHDSIPFPEPRNWDTLNRFQAFYHAIDWSSGSIIEGQEISAPFRAGIELDYYQLEPVARALLMPRVNLLIADDVGLGKTIEAGLVVQELLSRQAIRKIMIICPASLQQQWKEEMEDKFNLNFEIIDRETILKLRKEYGVHVNPWNSYPRIITSQDFIKREQPLNLFKNSLRHGERTNILKDWDMLIVDEAHNVAPSGRKKYIKDSDRTDMIRQLVDHFEHRLFLTATPHNGYTESFTALMEFLDPLRFSRGPILYKENLEKVMIRRLKDDIKDALGNRKFTKRNVIPIEVNMTSEEKEMYFALDRYIDLRLKHKSKKELLPIRFALVLLKKRLLSSPLAFYNSVRTHIGDKKEIEEPEDYGLMERMVQRTLLEDWVDDEEKSQYEEDALQEASKFFKALSEEEKEQLEVMIENSASQKSKQDAKAKGLISWIEENLCPNNKWNNERLLIFTEYKDTLEYIEYIFAKKGWEDKYIKLYGGMPKEKREEVKKAFQSNPSQSSTRILIATDAAAEGLNLQRFCRYLIHYEIPWNPNRMEQRNGRIDRHGQKSPEVYIYHFLYKNNEDSDFMRAAVEKVQQMREDLGSVGEIISNQVENAMVGVRKKSLDLSEKESQLKKVKEDVKLEMDIHQSLKKLSQKVTSAQENLELYPANIRLVLDEALKLMDPRGGLEEVKEGDLAGKGYKLKAPLPPHWRDCESSIKDHKGRLLALVFDHELAKDRNDVVLIHLNHPLMKKALGVFRKNLWSLDYREDHKLRRVSYKVLPGYKLENPAIVAFGRVVALNKLGRKLHESVIKVGAEIDQGELIELEDGLLESYLREEGKSSQISKEIGDKLRYYYPKHQEKIREIFDNFEVSETERLEKLFNKKAELESKNIEHLMKERIKELEKRLEEVEKQKEEMYRQTSLGEFGLNEFDEKEKEQFEEDINWLEKKLEDLKERMNTEPHNVKDKYALKNIRIFPMGLLYLIPDNMVEKEGVR